MKTLYTNNHAGATAATKDFIGALTGPVFQAQKIQVQMALKHFAVVRVRDLSPKQTPDYIRKLGMEVFDGKW